MQTIATGKFCVSQTIESAELLVSRYSQMDYGKRFRELRKARFKGTVLELAKRIGRGYPSTVYNIESDWRVPTLPTLAKHAEGLGCDPWELLEGVDAEVDRVRALAKLPKVDAEQAWGALLRRYKESTKRSGQTKGGAAHLARAAEREVERVQRLLHGDGRLAAGGRRFAVLNKRSRMRRTLPFPQRPEIIAKSSACTKTDPSDLEVLIRILKHRRPAAAIVVKDLVVRMLTKKR
jgi:transcriptional regulator with XRE-family HTH domain